MNVAFRMPKASIMYASLHYGNTCPSPYPTSKASPTSTQILETLEVQQGLSPLSSLQETESLVSDREKVVISCPPTVASELFR